MYCMYMGCNQDAIYLVCCVDGSLSDEDSGKRLKATQKSKEKVEKNLSPCKRSESDRYMYSIVGCCTCPILLYASILIHAGTGMNN